jgi:hypothetical protein
MIYEMRTYDLHQNGIAEFEAGFTEVIAYRQTFSPLAAFWHTEIGPLNQIIHVWPYEDLNERTRIRAIARKENTWPPNNAHLIARMQSDIMIPLPMMAPIKPGKQGPYFEICTDIYCTRELPTIVKVWERAIDMRLQFGPLCAMWYSDVGGLNKFQHIWPYQSLDQREEIRKKLLATGEWPPGRRAEKEGGRDYRVIRQESKIVMPAAFSPLQ